MNGKTKRIVLCAMFGALTGVLSQISVPLPFTPVPINLATLSACLAGGLLGAELGFISQIVYIFLGIIGIPVYAGFSSGLGILMGATGGYIIGYAVQSFIIGFMMDRLDDNRLTTVASMAVGVLGCYAFGTVWFMVVTKSEFISALMMCVVPFLAGDAVKIAAASMLVGKLKKYVSVR